VAVADAIPLFCRLMSRKRRTVADEAYLVVRTSVSDHGAGGAVGAHTHDWHQLIHVRAGLMTVRTEAGSWMAPPTWAVWVPAGVEHAIQFAGDSALRTCYLRPGWRADLPAACRALAVTPLLRELIARTSVLGMLDRRVAAESAMAELIACELADGEPSVEDQAVSNPGAREPGTPERDASRSSVGGPPSFSLPEPAGGAAAEVVRLIAAGSAAAAGTATLARAVGVGTRTLERQFRDETGMTLGRWRQQRMLLRGLDQLAGGASVAVAATAAGYGSPSAFIAAFRKAFGATPSRYFSPAR
jgi:AraC-like DNA-binding protein